MKVTSHQMYAISFSLPYNLCTDGGLCQTSFEYHVTCRQSNSKKKVTVVFKSGIVQAIKEKFKVDGDIIVQELCGSDWREVKTSRLGNSANLRFFVRPGIYFQIKIAFFIVCQGG